MNNKDMKNYHEISSTENGTLVRLARFAPADGGVVEVHAMVSVEPRGDSFADQLLRLRAAETALLTSPMAAGASVVFRRYFLSDATNTAHLLGDDETATCIQQPPLDGSKVAMWIYMEQGVEARREAGGVAVVEHNGYRQLWQMGRTAAGGDSATQTRILLEEYEDMLSRHGADIATDCIRTWFHVRAVDTHYAGMVAARKANFDANGLTAETHYVASTGIGGSPADPGEMVQFSALALTGLAPSQRRNLRALSHLNKTIDYGVTFERGTLVEFGDRGHAYISGTASIDNRGNVVHLGDIRRQTLRMWENVEALLAEGGMTLDDTMQIIVYLRDMADYAVVRQMFAEKFPSTPYVITLAPVCRPQWLIEMECIAIDGRRTPFARF